VTTTVSLLDPGGWLSGFMFDNPFSPEQLVAPFAGPGLGTGDPTSLVPQAQSEPGVRRRAEQINEQLDALMKIRRQVRRELLTATG
jgi:hypothetical protein